MKSIWTLTVAALVCGGIIALLGELTQDRIQQNQTVYELTRLDGLVDVTDRVQLCEQEIELYEVEVQGYGGPMTVAVAFQQGKLLGARVVNHTETPGFSKVLDPENWIHEFTTREFDDLDAVTGATITTKAVIRAVEEAFDLIGTSDLSC